MEKLDALLKYIIDTARENKLPVSDRILPRVKINHRAQMRFGACKRLSDGFEIEISYRLTNATDNACIAVLAHEVLHTCPDCMNHSRLWKQYAAYLGKILGVIIKCSTSCAELGIENTVHSSCKYSAVCDSCGKTIYRMRASKLILYPEKYRCICGGKFYISNINR